MSEYWQHQHGIQSAKFSADYKDSRRLQHSARDAEIASGLAPFEKAARVKNSCAGGAGCKIDVSRIG